MAQQQEHPIFDDIWRGDLEAVQQRVLVDGAVLEGRRYGTTPLLYAIFKREPAIALWIIQHRGQHDVNATNDGGYTAMHQASAYGPLAVVQALVAAGADPAALGGLGSTSLIFASINGHTDIVAFLLQLPSVKATIDHISQGPWTALSIASYYGHQPIVQLLLETGADPTVPAGPRSPINRALSNNHHAIAALLRHHIDEADRARALHKARSLLGAGAGATLACLHGRVEQGQALPWVELTLEEGGQEEEQEEAVQEEEEEEEQQQQQDEKLWATAAFAVGVSGGAKDTGLCEDLYLKLQGYMLPAWADKGPAGVQGATGLKAAIGSSRRDG